MTSPASLSRGTSRRSTHRPSTTARRRLFLEPLEGRALMAQMPFGAMPDDTGEYMLGDVYVNVVLMESDPTLAPNNANQENWSAGAIASVKSKIEEGIGWWKDTFLKNFPTMSPELLNFRFDYTNADTPVRTGYEPINNKSNAFEQWIKDFLVPAGFGGSDNFSTNIRAYNNAQRVSHGAQWSFTIFVVNDEHDPGAATNGGTFAPGGDFSQAFAYAGGQFMVVPAGRPASTFAHEAAHMFWAMDEYFGPPNNYLNYRGYYNTQNTNAADNTDPDFVQQTSLMTILSREQAYGENTSSTSSFESIGWKDTDRDGIFDVLDVPFSLDGTGRYDADLGVYEFEGDSSVKALPNRNSSGLGNDITINLIREAQYSIDGGAWTTAGTYSAYVTHLDLSIPVAAASNEIRIRTIDTVTGAMSPEYVANMHEPGIMSSSGVNGYVWWDSDFDGEWDPTESAASDFPVKLVDSSGNPLQMRKYLDGDDYSAGTVLNSVKPGVVLTAVNGLYRSDIANTDVVDIASNSSGFAGNVFGLNSRVEGKVIDTWTMASRRLKVGFTAPVATVSLRAYGGLSSAIGRLEAYDASGKLLDRYTTGVLGSNASELMTISRPTADIAFVVAGGHQSTEVVLDSLEWGAASMTTTGSDGSYRLPSLPAGDYRVKIDVPAFQLATTFIGGVSDVTVGNGAETVRFGVGQLPNPWHNSVRQFDVDDNGDTDASDILLVLHYFTHNLTGDPLPIAGPGGKLYIDIDNDGIVSAQDILYVIYKFNAQSRVVGTRTVISGEGPANSGGVASGLSTSPNGENPFFFDRIESDHYIDDHTHDVAADPASPTAANEPVAVLGSGDTVLTAANDDAASLLAADWSDLETVDILAADRVNATAFFTQLKVRHIFRDLLPAPEDGSEEAASDEANSAEGDEAILALLDEPLV